MNAEVRTPGLVALVSGVRDFFAAQGVSAVVDFGRKAYFELLNQGPLGASRVVFIPGFVDPNGGAPKSTDAGDFVGPRVKRDNPRPLLWWKQTVTVAIWGVDATDDSTLQSELAQYTATWNLIESTVQAIHSAVYIDRNGNAIPVGMADASFEHAQWISPPVERAFGQMFFAFMRHHGPVLDLTTESRVPGPAIVRDLQDPAS